MCCSSFSLDGLSWLSFFIDLDWEENCLISQLSIPTPSLSSPTSPLSHPLPPLSLSLSLSLSPSPLSLSLSLLKSCFPQLPTWACSLLSAAQPALTATPQAEGAAGRGDGTSQALAVASPHSYLPARGEGRTQGPVLSEGQAA